MDYNKELHERFLLNKEFLGDKKLVNKIKPLLSVSLITYQHAPYIRKCIEGILMQKTNFPIEVIIGEDESTDGTREICIEYAKKHQDKIRLFLRDRKLSQYSAKKGLIGFNGQWTRMSGRGKYIALCEGDDYWIDPLKLQKQIDFLEKNKGYSMVFHDAFIMEENKLTENRFVRPLEKTDFDTKDTLDPFHSFAPTSSIVFRNKALPINFPEWHYSFKFRDRNVFTFLSTQGLIKYLDFIGSVRRIQSSGISRYTTIEEDAKQRILFFKKISSHLKKEDQLVCNQYLKHYRKKLLGIYLEKLKNYFARYWQFLFFKKK